MFPLLALLFLVGPIAELAVIIAVGREVGVVPTVAGLVVAGLVGAWLAKREGVAAWRRLNDALAAGRMPTEEIADGAMILLAGALMAAPGFIGDALGLILLIPPLRAAIRRVVLPAVMRLAERRARRAAHDAARRAVGYSMPGQPGRGPEPDPGGGPWVIDGESHTRESTRVSWGQPESPRPRAPQPSGPEDRPGA
jgi:UPF0716 protein FxsA